MSEATFRIGFVDGVTPDRWVRRWRERRRDPIVAVPLDDEQQRVALDDGTVSMGLVRLPIETDGLHLISLYAEDQVVVMGTEHLLTLLDEVTHDDLAGEIRNAGPARAAIRTAAAGTGLVVVPRSVARMHGRKDVEVRRLVDAAKSTVALAWRRDLDDARAQDFVAIVRGRTQRSSRG